MNLIRKIFSPRSKPKEGDFSFFIQDIIGFKPKNLKFYETAFTHRSLGLRDNDGNGQNYERLEFLGDSMLSSVIASYLYRDCLLYTSPSPRDKRQSRMPSSA